MSRGRNGIQSNEIYARKVCLAIGAFGILLLYLFNFNFYLIFLGTKYESKVIEIQKEIDDCYIIELKFKRVNGPLVQKQIRDCTGESFLFWIEQEDTLKIWESKKKPYKHYVPYQNFAVKIFLSFFFIFVPFLFMILGRYPNTSKDLK